MSLLSIKLNFFKTIKILNIFQYILTHLTISNKIQYNKQDFFSNLAIFNCCDFVEPRKTVSMYLKSHIVELLILHTSILIKLFDICMST